MLTVLFDEKPEINSTLLLRPGDAGPVLTIYPTHIDWGKSEQRADIGTLSKRQFRISTTIGYSSMTEMIDKIRKIAPEVREIRTIIPRKTTGRVVIY